MKGVEAPFQLVVSVIAMLMVLVLAYMVLEYVLREDCNQKWQAELSKFASALSTVIHGAAPTKVSNSFDFRCGDAVTYRLSLVLSSNSNRCLRICGSTESSGCAFFHLRTYDRKGRILGETFACVEGASSYIPRGRDGCPTGYEDITDDLITSDPDGGIDLDKPFGTFVIRRLLGSNEPIVVCVR